MDMETTPDCVCKGTGRVPFPGTEGSEFPSNIPCGKCLHRYEMMHCVHCDKLLGDKTYPWPGSGWRCCAGCVPVSIKSFERERSCLLAQVHEIDSVLTELKQVVTL